MYEEVLVDWNFWGSYDIEYIDRDYDIGGLISNRYALVLYGVRRAGKSYLAYGYLKKLIEKGVNPKETLIVNFEDPRLTGITVNELTKIYEEYLKLTNARNPIVVLDEVQNVKGWEKFVRYLVENKRLRVIVAGSSSKLMSREYATVLTGRHVDLEVLPLSFREYLRFRGVELKDSIDAYKYRNRILSLLEEYLEFGGFPEVALVKDRRRKEGLLRTYFNDILAKDVAVRYNVRHYQLLESLARIYVTNVSRPLSLRKIARSLNKSLHTIERYTEYLETARMIILLKKISRKAREIEKSIRKIYVVDIGFHTKIGYKFTKDVGRVMENIVLLHLMRKYTLNKELFYYTTSNGREVDFVLKVNGEIKQLIQVTYELRREDHEQYRREIGALVKASRELSCKNLQVITWSQEDVEEVGNVRIKIVPLWKWLLGIS